VTFVFCVLDCESFVQGARQNYGVRERRRRSIRNRYWLDKLGVVFKIMRTLCVADPRNRTVFPSHKVFDVIAVVNSYTGAECYIIMAGTGDDVI